MLPFLAAPGCILWTGRRFFAAADNDGPDMDVAAGGSASEPDFYKCQNGPGSLGVVGLKRLLL